LNFASIVCQAWIALYETYTVQFFSAAQGIFSTSMRPLLERGSGDSGVLEPLPWKSAFEATSSYSNMMLKSHGPSNTSKASLLELAA
jgi:hypothetical protein